MWEQGQVWIPSDLTSLLWFFFRILCSRIKFVFLAVQRSFQFYFLFGDHIQLYSGLTPNYEFRVTLKDFEDQMWCEGANPGWPCARQVLYTLCYHYSPTLNLFNSFPALNSQNRSSSSGSFHQSDMAAFSRGAGFC